jgi:hypothetical protein
MTLDYMAFFADQALEKKVEELDWSSGADVAVFFLSLEKEGRLKVWGNSTEAWPLNAITEWLKVKCSLQNFGSELGRRLLTKCDYVHFVLPPAEIKVVLSRIQDLSPEDDETFDGSIEDFFSDMGLEYVDSFLGDGMGEFYQLFREFRADLLANQDKTLIVLIPG